MVQILNSIPAAQQLEVCGVLSKCLTPNKQLALPIPTTKNVFQVDNILEEDAVLMAMNLEHVFIDGLGDHQHIIIDTGSSYNLIGCHLLPILQQRLTEAGINMIVCSASKRFQFGGRNKALATAKINIPLLLGQTRVEAKVFIVDNKIPFLLGGNLIRQHKTEISVSDNMLTLNNQKIPLKLLGTGHMALP